MLSVSGMEMYMVYLSRTGSRLDALRIRYGDVYGDWHGGGGGSPHSCEWDAGDEVFIVQVENTRKIKELNF